MIDTKKLRQKILDLAIRGKLVPQDPNDEPASVLLERIRAEKERLIAEGKIKRPKKSKASSAAFHYQNFEPPFPIPDSWEWVRLEDIAKIGTGATPSKSNREYYGGNINWVSSSVTSFPYVDEPTDLITELALKETNCEIYPTGTLLMAMYGEGKTRGQLTELRIEAASNQACAAIIPYISETKNFVRLYLLANYYQLRRLAEGGNQPNLNLGKISSLFIPLPPIQEQRRVVEQYGFILESIELLEASKALLEERINMAKSKILDLAMQGKLVPQNPADESASDMLRRINPKAKIITDNPHLRNIPKNWCITDLKSVGKWQAGATPSKMNSDFYGIGYPWLNTGDLTDDYIYTIPKQITELALKETSVKLNPKGSVLIAMYGATIGKLGILTFPATTNQACCACAECYINNKFLFYFLKYYRPQFLKMGGGGAQSNISKEKIKKTILLLPPNNEQKRIVNKIEELYSIFDDIEASLQS